jgi:hypothetical protein
MSVAIWEIKRSVNFELFPTSLEAPGLILVLRIRSTKRDVELLKVERQSLAFRIGKTFGGR